MVNKYETKRFAFTTNVFERNIFNLEFENFKKIEFE